jgi:hypothetical protein
MARKAGQAPRFELREDGATLDVENAMKVPFFEHYPADGKYDPKTGAFSCDICVPVAPLHMGA